MSPEKMRRIVLFCVIIAILAVISDVMAFTVEPGVSRELALRRASGLSGIVYNLSLRIDSARSVKPAGRIGIEFDCRTLSEPLQLDFAGERVVSLNVNGKEVVSPEWHDGHLVIPAHSLVPGRNCVKVEFISADRALNRNPEYLYTLFVPHRAHSVFPCFDQPDMKATYNLSLTIPAGWKGVSNSPVAAESEDAESGMRTIQFSPTEPLSTYLFAFAAGKFEYARSSGDGRTIGAYHRETDPARLAQLDDIFLQVKTSLRKLEEYTGIPYPFAKYDLVIIPGFQFGGMEHTGATFYNDNALFLNRNATGADYLRRAQVIAHETSHMWFGDYVTMEWFDDVWVKEVFANYFAAMLARELLPEYDHDLEWLRVYLSASLDQDRTPGTTPIRQQLENMKYAGLIYNNVIYNKSPLMLRKLSEQTGEKDFQSGVRKYLADYPYGNADWGDNVGAFSACTDADVEGFCNAWVNVKGMPHISFALENDSLIVSQKDPLDRGVVWPQVFEVAVGEPDDYQTVTVTVNSTRPCVAVPVSVNSASPLIVPAADGRAYGLLTVDDGMLARLMSDFLNPGGICASLSPAGRLATLIMLNENYLAGKIATDAWLDFLVSSIEGTADNQMLSALTRYVGPALLDMDDTSAARYELKLLYLSQSHPSEQGKTLIIRILIPVVRSAEAGTILYDLWSKKEDRYLSEDDFSDLALHLAIMLPSEADSIIALQRSRIDNADRLRKFDYVSRAAVSDTLSLDSLFASLSVPANRLVEPWTLEVLSLLNHPLRHGRSVRYILPSLEMLPQIQQTGDIFFPANWTAALLGNYRSEAAAVAVDRFLADHPDMNPLLLNKIRQSADRLQRFKR